MHVSATENPEEASLFESFEVAHSSHDLSGTILKVLLSPFLFNNFCCVCLSIELLLVKTLLMNRNLASKPRQLELTARQSMGHFPEEMERYIFVSLVKDIMRKYGIMLLGASS